MIKSTILQTLSFFILVFLFTSCSKDVVEKKEISNTDYFMGLSEIGEIASGVQFPGGNGSKLKSTDPQIKSICSIDKIGSMLI